MKNQPLKYDWFSKESAQITVRILLSIASAVLNLFRVTMDIACIMVSEETGEDSRLYIYIYKLSTLPTTSTCFTLTPVNKYYGFW